MNSRSDDRRRKYKVYEVVVSVSLVSLAVVGSYKLFSVPPFLAVALGGAIGYGSARGLRLSFFERRDRTDRELSSMIGYRWAAFWVVALCAFRFLVALSWVESICVTIALITFFFGVERYNRSRAVRRGPHNQKDV
jgi:hypothetical protein